MIGTVTVGKKLTEGSCESCDTGLSVNVDTRLACRRKHRETVLICFKRTKADLFLEFDNETKLSVVIHSVKSPI